MMFMKNLPACFRLRRGLALLVALACAAPVLRAAAGSLFFSGTNQYVEVPNFQNVGVSNEVTVEFWANTATTRAQAAFVLNPDNPANRFLAGLN